MFGCPLEISLQVQPDIADYSSVLTFWCFWYFFVLTTLEATHSLRGVGVLEEVSDVDHSQDYTESANKNGA